MPITLTNVRKSGRVRRFLVGRVVFFLFLAFALYSHQAVAQGRTDCSVLNSRILHRAVRYCVMLPPSYESQADRKYPIIYFLHGLGQNEQALLAGGGWGLIEDLRQQHKIGDFLIAAPEGDATFFINSADAHDPYNNFLVSEFLPFIETHFRVKRDRRLRAVTGLSMGGFGALRFAFASPQLFGSVSAQSPALMTQSPAQMNADLHDAGPLGKLLGGVFGNPINLAHWKQNDPFNLARLNQARIKDLSIYFNCGAQDEYGFAEGATKLDHQLTSENVRHEFHLYPGGHSADYFLSHLGETIEFHWKAFSAAGEKIR